MRLIKKIIHILSLGLFVFFLLGILIGITEFKNDSSLLYISIVFALIFYLLFQKTKNTESKKIKTKKEFNKKMQPEPTEEYTIPDVHHIEDVITSEKPNVHSETEEGTSVEDAIISSDVKESTPDNKEQLSETLDYTSANNTEREGVTSNTVSTVTKSKNFRIAGTSYRKKEIESLGSENPEYEYTKRELEELCMEDERIYQYEFYPLDVEIVEEPDNPYDPNALKVIIDGKHVGYIKKGCCSQVKKLLRSGKITNITANIYGGKYKILYSDYDYERDKDVYTLERNTTNYSITSA